MAPTRRHAAARARVGAAGISLSTSVGMMAAMAVSTPAWTPVTLTTPVPDRYEPAPPIPAATTVPALPAATAPPAPRQQIIVVRRRYIHVPAGSAVPAPSPATAAPVRATTPAVASAPAAPRPAAPITPAPRPRPRTPAPPPARSSGS